MSLSQGKRTPLSCLRCPIFSCWKMSMFVLLLLSLTTTPAIGLLRGQRKDETVFDTTIFERSLKATKGAKKESTSTVSKNASKPPSSELPPNRGGFDVEERLPLITWGGKNKPKSMGPCEGKCKRDNDCIEGLICYHRRENEGVPGCEGGEMEDSKNDYCTYPLNFRPPSMGPTKSSYSWTSSPTPKHIDQPSLPPFEKEEPSQSPSTTVDSMEPSFRPSDDIFPSTLPSRNPSTMPSNSESIGPSSSPSHTPSMKGSASPSMLPSDGPSVQFSSSPSAGPSQAPSIEPSSGEPSSVPSSTPSLPQPSLSPSSEPSFSPSRLPSSLPSTTEMGILATAAKVQARIMPYALNGGDEFEDSESYQFKALKRTAQVPKILHMTDSKITQYYALYSIFEATNAVSNWIVEADTNFDTIDEIPGWISDTGWIEHDTDPCDGWYGITCDAAGHVTKIELFNNLLTGNFPAEVILLASDGEYSTGAGKLNHIDLFKNIFLSNNDSNWWWQHLGSDFEYFYFQQTGFGGDLGRLPTNLIELDCSYSLISGGLVDETFEGLNNLNYVVLDGNFFEEAIPSVFGRLTSLEFFYLLDGSIQGDLSYMNGMSKIIEHWVDFNPELRGTIPTSLGDLSTLASLSLTSNALSGTLPTEVGRLSNLQQLWLSGNSLTGSVPTELGLLRRLGLLQVEDNAMIGDMPSEVCSNYGFLLPLKVIGADCDEMDCPCCTCCSYDDCN